MPGGSLVFCVKASPGDSELDLEIMNSAHSHSPRQAGRTVVFLATVWPEAVSSAAGLRTEFMVRCFLRSGWRVVFGSASKENAFSERLRASGVECRSVFPNDEAFDHWIAEVRPDAVVYDRFVLEEQFGWRVRERFPHALRILDTQDLHALRRLREAGLKSEGRIPKGIPTELLTDDFRRELAAIYRCDLTLLVSDFEYEWLQTRGRVPEELLLLSRWSVTSRWDLAAQAVREGFAWIGNFRHPPNLDGLFWFAREIWPRVRILVGPQAKVRIYGAYPPRAVMQLHAPELGFLVEGSVPDQYEALSRAWVNLAPLRYGAGIKGKILDGWSVGTPVVSTSVGAEGMRRGLTPAGALSSALPFGGWIADSAEDFAQACATALEAGLRSKLGAAGERDSEWNQAQERGFYLLETFYHETTEAARVQDRVERLLSELTVFRARNVVGQILEHQSLQASRYLSKWIETKAKLASEPLPQ